MLDGGCAGVAFAGVTSARITWSVPPPDGPLARGLGLFRVAWGVAQVLCPRPLVRSIGVENDAASTQWMRAVGVREIVVGAGVASARQPVRWAWARVAGDVMDLALLDWALRTRSRRRWLTLAGAGLEVCAIAVDATDAVHAARASVRARSEQGFV